MRVRLIVEYDMDIDHVPTEAELDRECIDWIKGNVDLTDLVELDPDLTETTVRMELASPCLEK